MIQTHGGLLINNLDSQMTQNKNVFESHMLIMKKVVDYYNPKIGAKIGYEYSIILSILLFKYEADLWIGEMKYFDGKDIRNLFSGLFKMELQDYINLGNKHSLEVRPKDLSNIISQALRKFVDWGLLLNLNKKSTYKYKIYDVTFIRALRESCNKIKDDHKLYESNSDVYEGIFSLTKEGGKL